MARIVQVRSHMTKEDLLIDRLRKGQQSAINAFVDTYAAYLYSIAFNVLRSKFDAEEATQDSMMKAIKNIESFKQGSSFKAWLYSICFRTAIDHKRRNKITTDIDSLFDNADSNHADDQLLEDDMKFKIERLLSHLDDQDKTIIQLFYLDELSIKEVCQIMNMTESNIKIKLYRARKELALHAGKYFETLNPISYG